MTLDEVIPCNEVINNDNCEDCLPRPWNAWTEQRLFTVLQLCLVLY
jgi:hypothetical protein